MIEKSVLNFRSYGSAPFQFYLYLPNPGRVIYYASGETKKVEHGETPYEYVFLKRLLNNISRFVKLEKPIIIIFSIDQSEYYGVAPIIMLFHKLLKMLQAHRASEDYPGV